MQAVKAPGNLLICCLLLCGIAHGQDATLRTQYEQAMDFAQQRQLPQAWDLVNVVVLKDSSFYQAHVLRVALAHLLQKRDRYDPKKLIQSAKDQAPLGANVEQDIQNLINRLSGVPSVAPPETISIYPYVQRKLALVVGIGDFKDKDINKLEFAAADAQAFATTLKSECKFDQVQLLLNEQATNYNIKTAMNVLAKEAQSDDLVVIFFSSHGSPENLDTAGVNYIVTYDTEVRNLYPTAYEMNALFNDLNKRIRAERVVAFIDTCFSGGTFKELPPGWASAGGKSLEFESAGLRTDALASNLHRLPGELKFKAGAINESRKPQGAGRVIIASSRQSERSWEDERIQHGYFTYFLIEAIKAKTPVSVDELYSYLETNVPVAVRRDKNKEQHPTIVKNKEGQIEIYLRDEIDVSSRQPRKR